MSKLYAAFLVTASQIRDGGARHADLGCDHGLRSFSRFAKSVLRHEPLSLPLDWCRGPDHRPRRYSSNVQARVCARGDGVGKLLPR